MIQSELGYYPELNLSKDLYIQSGENNATAYPHVTPDNKCDEWKIKTLCTSDEGTWCEVVPAVGVHPAFDPCSRGREAIETPLSYTREDPVKTYTIHVRCIPRQRQELKKQSFSVRPVEI